MSRQTTLAESPEHRDIIAEALNPVVKLAPASATKTHCPVGSFCSIPKAKSKTFLELGFGPQSSAGNLEILSPSSCRRAKHSWTVHATAMSLIRWRSDKTRMLKWLALTVMGLRAACAVSLEGVYCRSYAQCDPQGATPGEPEPGCQQDLSV